MNSQETETAFARDLHAKLRMRVGTPFNEVMAPLLWEAKGAKPEDMDTGKLAEIQGRIANLISNMLLSNILTITSGNHSVARPIIAAHMEMIGQCITQSLEMIRKGDTDGVRMVSVGIDGTMRPFDFRDHLTPEDPADRNDSGRNGGIDAP